MCQPHFFYTTMKDPKIKKLFCEGGESPRAEVIAHLFTNTDNLIFIGVGDLQSITEYQFIVLDIDTAEAFLKDLKQSIKEAKEWQNDL